MHKKITIDEVMIGVASLFAQRSKCQRAQVGAVITVDNRIISTGYNGPLMSKSCDCNLFEPCKISVHAEANAIAFAAKEGIPLKGSTLYCNFAPCIKCAELIVQAGIKRVIYQNDFRTNGGLELLWQNGVISDLLIIPVNG